MKTTLEFNLPEEKDELDAALNGGSYKAMIDTFYYQILRPHLKYDVKINGELSDRDIEIIDYIASKAIEHFRLKD